MENGEERLKLNIAKNLAYYRKQAGLTQLELAEQINYSDKSISKWERGEGMPDVYVLTQLAALYGVTVDALLCDSQTPPPPARVQKKKRLLITLLSVGLVWLVATFVFFVMRTVIFERDDLWYCFLCAVPVTGIVAVVLCALWWSKWWQFISASIVIWGLAACLYVMIPNPSMYLIFIVGGVVEVLLSLWYVLKHYSSREKK